MNLTWRTEKRKIKDLKLFDGNPRKMSDKQAEQLLESLKKFNYVELIAIDQNNRVIAGNMRVQALKRLGREDEEIEVRVPNRPLTEEEAREYLLRSNKNTGEWDYDLLANFSEEELNRVGFESEELDKIFDLDLGEKEDEVPEPRKETNIKYGDIFQLGNHRVMCGDATKKEDVEKLMNGEKADMVFTDPPYNVDYSGKNEFLNKKDKGNRNQTPILNDNIIDFDSFCDNFISNIRDFINDYNAVYITFAGKDLITLLNSLKNNDFYLSQILVWVKNNIVLGRLDYYSKHELIIYGWWNKHKFYGEKQQSVWEIDKPLKSDLHPTMKPVELIQKAILNSSKRGDIVLDLFGGSGSTLIAAEELNRKCYMMELEPIYVQVIIDRWEQFTGQKAIKLN